MSLFNLTMNIWKSKAYLNPNFFPEKAHFLILKLSTVLHCNNHLFTSGSEAHQTARNHKINRKHRKTQEE